MPFTIQTETYGSMRYRGAEFIWSVPTARFGWIYDLRPGPDGCVYLLDSTNYAVRRIGPARRTVSTVVGTGRPGYTRDTGRAEQSALGAVR
jgi:hypothetical protein